MTSRRPAFTALSTLFLLLLGARATSPPSSLSTPCPVRLLNVPADDADVGGGGEGLALTPDGLAYLAGLPSPIYVVPALGVYRGGKSLLLNRVMNLTAPYAAGFGVGHAQSTHTRGIDVCAEYVEGLGGSGSGDDASGGGSGGGTIVWMDTEGLWSSEYSRGMYGPKIFSLALLFASAVLLNSVKVLSDQFFDFFAEEQKVARVLKAGLKDGGIPEDGAGAVLLPDGLSVFWVLQQPITYGGADAASAMAATGAEERCKDDDDGDGECIGGSRKNGTTASSSASAAALDAFLARPGDELRGRVRRDFVHHMHEVPLASHDARLWEALDTLPDEQLLPEYVHAGRRLRTAVLRDLPRSRPLSNGTIATQMRLYLELVATDRYSAGLAREVFEETELGRICDTFAARVCNLTGSLPARSVKLGGAFIEARRETEPRAEHAADLYHLDGVWKDRLRRCLSKREADMRAQNADRILDRWREEAGEASEDGGRCYFLGGLLGGGSKGLLSRYVSTYNEDFGPGRQEQAAKHARQLQRTRLMECVRLRDVVMVVSPLLAWLFCRAYLKGGTPSTLGTMIFHGVILLGSYSFFQMTGQLPPYLDLDYAFLKDGGDGGRGRDTLDLLMRLPPSIPWSMLAYLVRTVGAAFAAYKVATYLASMFRPAGAGREVHQMLNLELKVNRLRKVADAEIRSRIVDAALDASTRLDADDGRGAFRALLGGMAYAIEVGDEELAQFGVSAGFTKVAVQLVRRRFRMPPRGCAVDGAIGAHRLDEFALSGDLQKLLGEMIKQMGQLTKAK